MNQYLAGVAHPLPVPDCVGTKSTTEARLFFGHDAGGRIEWWPVRHDESTHWCWVLLPEIPKPKTQNELDCEYADRVFKQEGVSDHNLSQPWFDRVIREAIAYGRSTSSA